MKKNEVTNIVAAVSITLSLCIIAFNYSYVDNKPECKAQEIQILVEQLDDKVLSLSENIEASRIFQEQVLRIKLDIINERLKSGGMLIDSIKYNEIKGE